MRVLVATALMLAAVTAHAEVMREVAVESDPPGADVYLNSKDEGSICKTPCTIKAPVGESVIIVEIAGHVSKLESLVVPRRGKPPTAKFKLVRALGTVTVKGPAGAAIRIDGKDAGTAPATLEIDAGPHTVTLAVGGKQVLQDLIEVVADDEVIVRGTAATTGPTPVESDPPSGGGVSDGAAPRRPARGPLVAASAIVDVGYRRFRYDGPQTENTQIKARENGVAIAGAMVEVWIGTLAKQRALRGLSLMGRAQFPLTRQVVKRGNSALMGDNKAFWQLYEISARHRWTIGERGTVEISTGFVRDSHQYDIAIATDRDFLPIAVYDSIRIGARGSLLFGAIEPYLTAENRIVLSGGETGDRFSGGGNATGLHAALGVRGTRGRFAARLEGAVARYSWTFDVENVDDPFRADGAVDLNAAISASLSFVY